ncbi:basic proline-rich protein-like [Choloepus didactylus]|uniref:basic proline-rich protein-like n=1 Tax=Choloepus didactylus TaxID=27675 RepID=UPI00189D372C|nr:basic proline-rich protein-like [Choloepus didactylus]
MSPGGCASDQRAALGPPSSSAAEGTNVGCHAGRNGQAPSIASTPLLPEGPGGHPPSLGAASVRNGLAEAPPQSPPPSPLGPSLLLHARPTATVLSSPGHSPTKGRICSLQELRKCWKGSRASGYPSAQEDSTAAWKWAVTPSVAALPSPHRSLPRRFQPVRSSPEDAVKSLWGGPAPGLLDPPGCPAVTLVSWVQPSRADERRGPQAQALHGEGVAHEGPPATNPERDPEPQGLMSPTISPSQAVLPRRPRGGSLRPGALALGPRGRERDAEVPPQSSRGRRGAQGPSARLPGAREIRSAAAPTPPRRERDLRGAEPPPAGSSAGPAPRTRPPLRGPSWLQAPVVPGGNPAVPQGPPPPGLTPPGLEVRVLSVPASPPLGRCGGEGERGAGSRLVRQKTREGKGLRGASWAPP